LFYPLETILMTTAGFHTLLIMQQTYTLNTDLDMKGRPELQQDFVWYNHSITLKLPT